MTLATGHSLHAICVYIYLKIPAMSASMSRPDQDSGTLPVLSFRTATVQLHLYILVVCGIYQRWLLFFLSRQWERKASPA